VTWRFSALPFLVISLYNLAINLHNKEVKGVDGDEQN